MLQRWHSFQESLWYEYGPALTLWRAMPAFLSAFLILLIAAGGFYMVTIHEVRLARRAGYSGPELAVLVKAPVDKDVDKGALTRDLTRFATVQALAVAYRPQPRSGFITVLDEGGYFRNGGIPLAKPLLQGPGPKLLVSSHLSPSGAEHIRRFIARDGEIVGEFVPEVDLGQTHMVRLSGVLLEHDYPIALFNPEAVPFGEGAYIFAGDRLAKTEIIQKLFGIFESHGLEVRSFSFLEQASFSTILKDMVSSRNGLVFLFAFVITLLVGWMILHLYALLTREKWMVVAILGAGRMDLIRLIVREMLDRTGRGAIWGGILALAGGFLLSLMGALPAMAPVLLVPLAVLFAGLLLFIMAVWVAWWELRGVLKLVPI